MFIYNTNFKLKQTGNISMFFYGNHTDIYKIFLTILTIVFFIKKGLVL